MRERGRALVRVRKNPNGNSVGALVFLDVSIAVFRREKILFQKSKGVIPAVFLRLLSKEGA